MPLQHILILSAILFFMGLLGVLTRRNAIMTLASLEIMINAACLNFVAFWRYGQYTDNSQGLLFALFAIAVAAAEAAVGLALVIALYRHYKTVDVEKFRFGLAAATTSTAPASSDSKSASKTTQKQKPQSPKSSTSGA